MGCGVSGERLWSWIDGEAPELEEHLAVCPSCRAEAARIREEIGLFSTDAEPPLPERVGPYTVTRLLGEGGQALVYEAEQPDPKRLVALKVLKGGHLVEKARVRLFRRETHTLGRFNHPAIATIYEAGRTQEGLHYFAMELVGGEPLDVFVNKEAPSHERLLSLIREVCEAVHHAHEHGVVHRDLKPSNIMIDPSGKPKVLDFGLARLTHSGVVTGMTTTKDGRVEGTPRYMSPEQALGLQRTIDARSDVYALGVILYEMLTGQPPSDVSAVTPDTLRAITQDIPTKPSRVNASLRGDLDAIILKCLEKEPERRYQSVAGLAEDISRYLDGRPVVARRPDVFYTLRKRLAIRRSWTAVALAAAALLLFVTWRATKPAYDTTRARHSIVRFRSDLFRDNATEIALFHATDAPRRYPGLVDATLVSAQALCLKREQNSAIGLLNEELERDPAQWPCRALLDEITARSDTALESPDHYWSVELATSAEAWYMRSLATLDVDTAIARAREALARDPEHHLALATVARLSEITGDLEETLRAARRLADLGRNPYSWLRMRAINLVRMGRFEEALADCDEMVVLAPDRHFAAYHLRAKILRRLRRYAEAERDLTRAIKTDDPSSAWQLHHRGTMRWILGQREGAIEDYREAYTRLTFATFANARLYILLRETGRREEAEVSLADAITYGDVDPWLGTVLECLGGRVSQQDLVAAGEAARRPARACEAYYYAGEAALLAADTSAARSWFQKCVGTGVTTDQDNELDPMSEFELADWRLTILGSAAGKSASGTQ